VPGVARGILKTLSKKKLEFEEEKLFFLAYGFLNIFQLFWSSRFAS